MKLSSSSGLPDTPGQAFEVSLAVLPLVNASGDPEQEYLSEGITEDLILQLSRVSGLYVISRDQAFSFARSNESIGEFAVKLGVQYLLQGNIKKAGDQISLSARIVDAHMDKEVWSQWYVRNFNQIFDLQNDLTRDAVQALHLDVIHTSGARASRNLTENIDAYRFYLMGRSYFHRGHTKRVLRLARQMFQRALALQPNYAAAHAGLADCSAHLLEAGDLSISTNEILEHSEIALSLDSTLAEAHASKGLALYTINCYDEADQSYERAIELQPDLFEAYYFYGRNCLNRGQFAKAADLYGQAAMLKRDDFHSFGLQAMCLRSMALLSEARKASLSALARTERAVAERPDEADALSFGAGLLADLGELSRTRDWAQRALAIDPDDFHVGYNVACAFASLGERDLAIDHLERIIGPHTLPSQREYLMHDCDFDVLHDHPRFVALLKS